MPRFKNRKSQKGLFDAENIQDAVEAILQGGSLKTIARNTGLNRNTLRRYVRKQRAAGGESLPLLLSSIFASYEIFYR